MHNKKLFMLLCAAAMISGGVAAGDVVSYSFPAFNATTTIDLEATTNSTTLTTASILFEPGRENAEINRTEGFLLLRRPIDIWRAGVDGQPALEASFNTSFTMGGANPVAFVVLLDSLPAGGSLRGKANETSSSLSTEASDRGLAAVEIGSVMSYGPYDQDVGLNVTVTPSRATPESAALAVWIEYDAGEQSLSVYVAAAGKPRPSKALLDVPLRLAGLRTTETAYIGFFAAKVRDVINDVRDWNLTVDKFPEQSVGNGNKGSMSRLLVVLAMLGSMAATLAI